MTIGAANRNLDHVNPDFKCLLDLKMRLDKEYGIELGLSMGMSDDFEEAIKMGASNVRIGSKIFGGR